MAIKINNTTIIDDGRNIVNAGVVTATGFVGSGAGLTGVSGIATNTSINTSGIVTASSFVGNLTGNVTGNLTGTASTATAAGTAFGLTGSPNVTVGVLTATTISTGSTTGTSGQVLQSTGTGVTWTAAAAGGFSNMQVFTSPGTFTVPATTTKVKVIVTGGGGGGIPPSNAGNGGDAAGTGIAIINIPGPASVPVTIGAAGVSGPSGGAIVGGDSTFGTYVTAKGGGPSFSSPSTGSTVNFPQPAPTYVSTITVLGGSGSTYDSVSGASKLGGSSYWGNGGGYNTSPTSTVTRSAFGGGGGASQSPGYPTTLYNGGQGIVVVEW